MPRVMAMSPWHSSGSAVVVFAVLIGVLATPGQTIALSSSRLPPRVASGPQAVPMFITSGTGLAVHDLQHREQPIHAEAPVPASVSDTAPAPAPNIIRYTARCSHDAAHPILLDSETPCPPACPFSQEVAGVACEKVCVEGSQCSEFHPMRVFADTRSMSCSPACGSGPQHIKGCTLCSAPGICKRCARSLFGLNALELSDDGRRCENLTLRWWYALYIMASITFVGVGLLVLQLACQPTERGEHILEEAQDKRLEHRHELIRPGWHDDTQDFGFFGARMHRAGNAVDWLGGRGVALYFNWVLFGIAVACVLGITCFLSWSTSPHGHGNLH